MARLNPKSLILTRRADGRYCKKIDGVLRYFGRDETEAHAALLDFLRLRQLQDGSALADAVTVQEVAETFAASCRQRVAAGKLQQETFDDYDGAIALFVASVGPTTHVTTLRAEQFAAFRAGLAKRLGTYALDRNVQAIRTMFRWSWENGVISERPRFGEGFKKSTAADRGYEQAARRQKHGDKRFTADELRALMTHADCKGDLRTFILLGLNAGFYSVDCSDLLWSEVKVIDGRLVIDRLRGKTKRRQMFPCWPEVAKTLNARVRNGDRVFMTVHGNAWNRKGIDSISMLFQRLRAAAGVTRGGTGFGALRHTHVSTVKPIGDPDAGRLVRGHQIEGIDRHYDFPSIERLERITDHARQELLLHIVPASCDWIVRPAPSVKRRHHREAPAPPRIGKHPKKTPGKDVAPAARQSRRR